MAFLPSGAGAPYSADAPLGPRPPLYHFIKAKAPNKPGDYPEAIKALKMIIKLPTLRTEENKKFVGPAQLPQRAGVHLTELADALRMNGSW